MNAGHGVGSGRTGARAWVADDLEIIRRVLSGEPDEFAELIARYQPQVARIENRHVPTDLVAEVAHDVFVRAYHSLWGFAGERAFDQLSELSR